MTEKKGFTLIELLIVMALIGTLTGIAALGLMQWKYNSTINEYRDLVLADLEFARSKSITSVPYVIVPGNGSYLLGQLNDTNNNLQKDPGENYNIIKTELLPNGLTIQYSNGQQLWFDRKGIPRTSNWALGMGTITIQYQGLNRTITVSSSGRIQYES